MINKSLKLEAKKREADLTFIERVKTATQDELEELHQHYSHPFAPSWKLVAIERALAKALGKKGPRRRISTAGFLNQREKVQLLPGALLGQDKDKPKKQKP